jgi:hypothetical protein
MDGNVPSQKAVITSAPAHNDAIEEAVKSTL